MDTTTTSTVNSGFVGIKFCQEWSVKVFFIYLFRIVFLFWIFFSNNMLYPKEDKENRILLYAVTKFISFIN
jgi:hypothetical protein